MKSYTKLQCFVTFFLLCFMNLGCNAKIQNILNEGDVCWKDYGKNTNYICQNLENCPVAINELKKNIQPQICSSNGKTKIVCCPPEKNTHNKTTTTTINSARVNPVFKTYSAATEKCKEYSELIYVTTQDPMSTALSVGKYTTITDCYVATPLITNGDYAEPKEFPHMALLGYGETPDNESWLCGGSLISNRYVLTAAHCEKLGKIDEPKYAKWAHLGELDYTLENDYARPADYKIVKRIIHPNYNPLSLYHDIALFQLERDVDFSAYVRPICLNTDNITPSEIVATGWGQTASNKIRSSRLLKVEINTISTVECNNLFANMANRKTKLAKGIVGNLMLCTGKKNGGKDTCYGDSGGPIQIQHNSYKCMYSQIGITSFGQNTCGQLDSVSCYTRVSNYISWIERIVWPKM